MRTLRAIVDEQGHVELPARHRDPFDRLLICQALAHGMVLATVDEMMKTYPVALALMGL